MIVHPTIESPVPSQDFLLDPTLVPVGSQWPTHFSSLLNPNRELCFLYRAKNSRSGTYVNMVNHIHNSCCCFHTDYFQQSLGTLSPRHHKSINAFQLKTLPTQELFQVNFFNDFYQRYISSNDLCNAMCAHTFICNIHDVNTLASASRLWTNYSLCPTLSIFPGFYHHNDPNVSFQTHASSDNTNNSNGNNLFLPGTDPAPVINLSSFQLTPAMISLLSKGLNFCPNPGEPERFMLRQDLDKFHVSLRRNLFFAKIPDPDSAPNDSSQLSLLDTTSTNEGDPFDHYKFRKPSLWNPKGPFYLEAFITVNEHSLNDFEFPIVSEHNLNNAERHALAELTRASDIVIKPADKGSAVVIQNLDDYIQEGLRHLSDPLFYRETKEDLTKLHNDLITDLINSLNLSMLL